jgi:hypothetical protein
MASELCRLNVQGAQSGMSDPSETPEQRRARYLRFAAEAEAIAEQCRGSDLRNAYRALARSWSLLALDIKLDGDKEA